MTQQRASVVYSLSLIKEPVGASEVCSYLPPQSFSGFHLLLFLYKVINTGTLSFVLHGLVHMCSFPSRQKILVCVHFVNEQAMKDKCNKL
jgi:hypothetical protein